MTHPTNSPAPAVVADLDKLEELAREACSQFANITTVARFTHTFTPEVVAQLAAMARSGAPAPALDGELNGGMHASIFVKVWGDAGGGDAGRIALANYAYELGRRAAPAVEPSAEKWRKLAVEASARVLVLKRELAASRRTAGDAPIYQVQFLEESGTSAWRDASEDAYNTFMPERRRIVYAAPVSAGQAGQVAKAEPVAYLRWWASQHDEGHGNIGHNEWYEVCEPHDKSVDGTPAFPVFDQPAESAAAPADAQLCTYPKCNCPFDAPADPNWCARGLKHGAAEGASKP